MRLFKDTLPQDKATAGKRPRRLRVRGLIFSSSVLWANQRPWQLPQPMMAFSVAEGRITDAVLASSL